MSRSNVVATIHLLINVSLRALLNYLLVTGLVLKVAFGLGIYFEIWGIS